MRSLILAAALILAPLAAGAAEPAKPPPSPAEIAAARAEADQIIADAGVADLFTNGTDSNVVEVRHTASGVDCTFDTGSGGRITLTPGLPRGEAIGCQSKLLDFTKSLFVSHPARADRDQAMRDSVAAIRQVFKDVQPYRGQSVTMSQEGESAARAPAIAAFEATDDAGKRVITVIAVAERNGWIIKLRLTGPIDKAFEGNLIANIFMRGTLLRLDEKAS